MPSGPRVAGQTCISTLQPARSCHWPAHSRHAYYYILATSAPSERSLGLICYIRRARMPLALRRRRLFHATHFNTQRLAILALRMRPRSQKMLSDPHFKIYTLASLLVCSFIECCNWLVSFMCINTLSKQSSITFTVWLPEPSQWL